MPRFRRQLALLLLLAISAGAEQHPVRTHYVLERWLAALGGKAPKELAAYDPVAGRYVDAMEQLADFIDRLET